jgi:HEXXH motif-containing protein
LFDQADALVRAETAGAKNFFVALAGAYVDLAIDALGGGVSGRAQLDQASDRPAGEFTALRCAVSQLLPGAASGCISPVLRDAAADVLRDHARCSQPRTSDAGTGCPARLWDSTQTPLPASYGRMLYAAYEASIAADLAAEGSPARLSFARPSGRDRSTVAEAIELVADHGGADAAALLTHIDVVIVLRDEALSEHQLFSVSNSLLTGGVFLGAPALRSRLACAEALVHEATHQRLYDLTWTRALYAPGYSEWSSPRVVPPWYSAEAGGGLAWAADRVLAALHVYAHLLVLWATLLDGAWPASATERGAAHMRRERAQSKAHTLFDLATGTELSNCYGPDGRDLINKLGDVVYASREHWSSRRRNQHPVSEPLRM